MTKVTDKHILQLGLKASSGDTEAETALINHLLHKHGLTLAEATPAPSEPETVETTTEPEPEPPQEAV